MIVLPLPLWSLGLEVWSPLQDKKGMTSVRPEGKEGWHFPFLRMHSPAVRLLLSTKEKGIEGQRAEQYWARRRENWLSTGCCA